MRLPELIWTRVLRTTTSYRHLTRQLLPSGRLTISLCTVLLCLGFMILVTPLVQADDNALRERIYHVEGEPITLTLKTDRLVVRYTTGSSDNLRRQARLQHETFRTALGTERIREQQIEILTLAQPAIAANLERWMREMEQNSAIESVQPVYLIGDREVSPTGELFIQFLPEIDDNALEQIMTDYNLEVVKKNRWHKGNYLLRVTPDSPGDAITITEQLAQLESVEFSEPNFLRRLSFYNTPLDPQFGNQWHLHNDQPIAGAADCDMDALEGWCVARGSNTVTIAVLDAGCDLTHPDLIDRYVEGRDVWLGTNNPKCNPWDGHGTACAGIAAASTNNGIGIAGIDWNAGIMPIRIGESSGGSGIQVYDHVLAEGIWWAYAHGADVISCSFGGLQATQIRTAIRDAVTNGRNGKGTVVIFSAGNSNLPELEYPAAYPEAVSVAATTPGDAKKEGIPPHDWGSNFGDGLDFGAPGVSIVTTDNQGGGGYTGGDYNSGFAGTSAATPMVAGLASLLIAKYDNFTGEQIRSRIQQTCDKVGGYDYDLITGICPELGHGRINIYRALTGKPQVDYRVVPGPQWPSMYSDYSDARRPYRTALHKNAACECLGEEFSPERDETDGDDPDGKSNIAEEDAFDRAVEFFPPYIPDEKNKIKVTVSIEENALDRYAANKLYLNVWFDWEADNIFKDNHDWVEKNMQIDPQTWGGELSHEYEIEVTPPAGVVDWHLQNNQPARFLNVRTRLTYNQQLQKADDIAEYGEVEDDYFLNFVEMFDIDEGWMEIEDAPPCATWFHETFPTGRQCDPDFMPIDGVPNGWMTCDQMSYGVLKTPSFDLSELTEAFLRFDYSGREVFKGRIKIFEGTNEVESIPFQSPQGFDECKVFRETVCLTGYCGKDNIVVGFEVGVPAGTEPEQWIIDNVIVWGQDKQVPDDVVPLATRTSHYTAQLLWLNPGDDKDERIAELYSVRYNFEQIHAGNWKHSLWVRPEMATIPIPGVPFTPVQMNIRQLGQATHFFCVRTLDEVNNISGFGVDGQNRAPVQTAPRSVKHVSEGDVITFTVTATDPDFDIPIMLVDDLPTNATYDDDGFGTGSFRWPTESGDAGIYVIGFTARDPGGLTDEDRTTIIFSGIEDCNNNLTPDDQDILEGASQDVDGNGIPDECELTCPPEFDWSLWLSGVPPAMAYPKMVFDRNNQVTVLFGGLYNSAAWERDAAAWRSFTRTGAPAPRYAHDMVYDTRLRRSIVFGGSDLDGAVLGDMWMWDAATHQWGQIQLSGSAPQPRYGHAMAYDFASNSILLYGGKNINDVNLGDLWRFDSRTLTWEEIPATGPPPLAHHRMVFDPDGYRLILYGGLTSSGTASSETWAFDCAAETWHQLSPTANPGPRWGFDMVFDPFRGVAALYGGADWTNNVGTWEFVDNNWIEAVPPHPGDPGPLYAHAMAFDWTNRQVVLFGGLDESNEPSDKTWLYPEASAGDLYVVLDYTGNGADGSGWAWNLRSPDMNVFDIIVEGPDPGSPVSAVVDSFAASINAVECQGLRAKSAMVIPSIHTPPFPQDAWGLRVTAGGSSPFELWVRDHEASPGESIDQIVFDCEVQTYLSLQQQPDMCKINPEIISIEESHTDYNGNFTDDAVDILLGTSLDENENGIPDESEVWPAIKIEKTHNTMMGREEQLSITIENYIFEMGGFDFLIAYDASTLSFTRAEPGQLLEDCGWEYFTYRYGVDGNCGDACPSGLLRIIAMADLPNGTPTPSCFGPPDTDPYELAELTFLVTEDLTFESQYIPIKFFWGDCGDNTISSVEGHTLWMDRAIYDFTGNLLWDEDDDDEFPEDARPQGVGAPDYCLEGMSPDKPTPDRFIDFWNGGIDIIPIDSIDAKGDININGLANEISDAILFANYFIYGPDVWHPLYYEGQIAATDINNDGIVLTVADLVYLIRIITGDASPYPKLTPDQLPAEVDWSVDDGHINIDFAAEADAGAMLLAFDHQGVEFGEPVLNDRASSMTFISHDDGAQLRILLYSTESGARIHGRKGNLITIPLASPANGVNLAEVEAADYHGNIMAVEIARTAQVPQEFALFQNVPNPFNASTRIDFNLPEPGEVMLTVYDVLGRKVTTLIEGHLEPGEHRIIWNGRDDSGANVASGVYFYRITTATHQTSRKMVLIK